PVLLVRHLLHPVDRLAVQFLLNRDVRHRRAGHRAVPVLLARWTRDDIARANDLYGPTPALHAAAVRRDDERLAERMRAPVAARARQLVHASARPDAHRHVGLRLRAE